MARKEMFGIVLLATGLTLSACSGDNNNQEATHDMAKHDMEEADTMDHSKMNHSSDGTIPSGLKEAASPTFPVGSKALIETDHMDGMKGAEATIVGAFDTTAYIVSYTPTNGGEPVTNHKWVIQEELEVDTNEPLEPGAQATMDADHMEGMQGAKATIDSAVETTVYMVDYTSTNGEKVKNHKWVTESELSAIEE
ncbi:YdhK family protein [Ureibacillus aquaedulcis]|uniref:YdhK family protein n=1 Tax=Ureibacillus aquaedulcis TaxID=3058421 RepID=A0ABT8GMR1_9BACL|nr:YdhK family protein [Ureibacillus sp. BA0131]MDN4492586.1 YdhK family protein [Ureibacillus sp. BA0131]